MNKTDENMNYYSFNMNVKIGYLAIGLRLKFNMTCYYTYQETVQGDGLRSHVIQLIVRVKIRSFQTDQQQLA